MIVAKLVGGLGNQMFQYAAARNIAERNKTTIKLDIAALLDRTPRRNFTFRNYDLDLLHIKESLTLPSHFAKKTKMNFLPKAISAVTSKLRFKIYTENPQMNYDPKFQDLPDTTYLKGYFQSEKYFKNIEQIIRKEFTFTLPIVKKALSLKKEIESTQSVCINVRRTDYVTDKETNSLLGEMSLDYYKNAMQLIDNKVKNPHYFVFSDDITWCKSNLKIQNTHTFVGHEFAGYKFSTYLQLMIICKHFIIPNSTFAWWAAWLSNNNDKIVIGPKGWFRDKNMNSADIMPDTWIKI